MEGLLTEGGGGVSQIRSFQKTRSQSGEQTWLRSGGAGGQGDKAPEVDTDKTRDTGQCKRVRQQEGPHATFAGLSPCPHAQCTGPAAVPYILPRLMPPPHTHPTEGAPEIREQAVPDPMGEGMWSGQLLQEGLSPSVRQKGVPHTSCTPAPGGICLPGFKSQKSKYQYANTE